MKSSYKNKCFFYLLFLLTVLFIFPKLSIAQPDFPEHTAKANEDNNTDVGTKILGAITIAESSDMHFGTMTVPTENAEVDLAVDGTVSVITDAVTLLSQAPTSHAAAYSVTGDPNATYAITLPANGLIQIISEGIYTMSVIDFISSVGATSTLGSSGDDVFTVGATIQLTDAQHAGTYIGTFDVSVAYN